MYLVLITYLTGDTEQESFNSKADATLYAYRNLDYVESIEIKAVR